MFPWLFVIVIDPAALAMVIPSPSVSVAKLNPLVESLPMSSCPSDTVDASSPVPPFAT